MKCKRCGYKARTIASLAAHYRKKHPSVMRKRSKVGRKSGSFCSKCGRKL